MELVVVPCHFDSALLETVDAYAGAAGLPSGWRAFPWPDSTQRLGQLWFEEGQSAVLEVPSAVVPTEKNYLLNPEHPRFGEIALGTAERFDVDPRLGR